MKSQALQEMIQKIFSDEETKAQFVKDPESIISHYSLTESEKKAVLSTHARLGLVASDSATLTMEYGPLAFWS